MKTQIKEIINEVKNNGSATLSLSQGNEAGVKALMTALNEVGLETEIVTIGGSNQGLYVSPKWDSMINTEALEEVEEISPLKSGSRTLIPSNSSAIKMIEWQENGDLMVTYQSSNIPYTYVDVPESKFLDLVEIEQSGGSVGSYVARQIKPFHSATKAIA